METEKDKCVRCGHEYGDLNTDAACPECGMSRPDPEREARIERRIHQMSRIHEIEREMIDEERDEWIMYGMWILRRKNDTLMLSPLIGMLGGK